MRRPFLTCLLSAPCLILVGNASASVVISDDPGTSANWQEVTDANDPAAGLYVLNCGNSCVNYQAGGYNFIGFSYGANLSDVVWGVGNEYTPTAITPTSEGTISGMNLSVQGRNGSYDGTEIAFLLIQNGNYYRTAFDVWPVGNASEMTYSLSGLTAASFGQFIGVAYGYSDPNSISGQDDGSADFSKNPDFSATAAPITLGYLAAYNSSYNTSPPDGVAYNGVNMFDATVNFGSASVPEPASIASLSIAGMFMLRRRRRA
jgi:hypothetical protein